VTLRWDYGGNGTLTVVPSERLFKALETSGSARTLTVTPYSF
jgi:hypothetical protein